ncbi:hypothetical protein FACS1894176_05460 [Bacteroidia bacterium]|nr:hypothetical protein FACS1894176_05460 [Bacteroidia bacterium]
MFKITWDKNNNGVLLTMKSTNEVLNVSPRPVFFEELDLLGLDKYWQYPKSKEPMKTAPLYRLLKEVYGTDKQPNVLVFEGVRAEESNRRALYDRVGKGVKHNNVVNVRPIFDWNATEIYLYLFMRQLPINKGYRNGLSRVGCSICPYSTRWSEHIVEKKYPANINKFVDEIKESLSGIKDKKVYLKEGNWKLRAGGKNMNIKTVSIDRYAGFGLRKVWLDKFYNNPENFFESDQGLNPTKQIPPFTCWLHEAEILNRDDKKISKLGKSLFSQYSKNKTMIVKQPYNDLSPVTVAYSLYRYAASKKRYALTASELYDAKQTEGVYRQFGVSRERFETILRTLKEDKNRVLSADFNMGLDNINLREDLTSMNILEMLL